MTTAVQLQLRRDTAANLAASTPAQGEAAIDLTRNRLAIGDGSTAGGWPHAKIQDAQGYGFVANFGLTAAVASNNLTLALVAGNGNNASAANSIFVPFRSATLTTGTPSFVEITAALSIVLADGDTIGAVNATPLRLWVVLFNNGGTPVLGVINCRNGTQIAALDESILQSPTSTIGNSAGVFYSGASVTANSPFRILGYVEYSSGLTTAGVYNVAPTKLQLFGPGVKKPGDVVQEFWAPYTSNNSTANHITIGASAPAIANGIATASQAIAASSAANLMFVEGQAYVDGTTANAATCAFLYNGTSVVAAGYGITQDTGGAQANYTPPQFKYVTVAGSTSSVTYTLYGGAGGGSGTVYVGINANGTLVPFYADTFITYLHIREIAA